MSRYHRLSSRAFECPIAVLLLLAIASPIRAQAPSFQVIVHAANPATEISARTASEIFLGKITRWPAGASITPYDLTPDSAVRADFSREIHDRSTSSIRGYWQRLSFEGRGVPPEQRSPSGVIDAVRATPGAIAYVGADAILPSGVKRLRIVGARDDDRTAARGDNGEAVPEGALLALAVSPAFSDTVWASFQGRGLWTSEDGGDTWSPALESPEPALSALAFDLVDSGLLLTGGEHGLYRSLDLGHRWQRVQAGDARLRGIRGIITLPQSPGTFIVYTDEALLRSDDSGATFVKLEVPDRVRAFTVDPITGDLWLATRRSIQVSQDRGESWSLSMDLAGRLISGPILVTHLAGTKTLWLTSDRVLLRAELDEEGPPAEGLADSPRRAANGTLQPSLKQAVRRLYALDDTIYATTEYGVYELAADGQNWQRVSEIPGAKLAADPYGSGRVFAGNAEGRIWRRDHSVDVWRQMFDIWNPYPPLATMAALTEEDPPAAPPSSVPLRLRCAPVRGHVGALAVHPSARGVLWAASEHGVFRSDDGGRSWGPPGRGLAITDVHSLAVDPKTPTTIWAGTHGGGVYVSRDGGASWTAAGAGIPGLRGAAVREVMVDPSVPDLLYAATPGGVYVSRDRGAHWRTLTALAESGNLLARRAGGARAEGMDPAWQIAPRALAVDPDSHHPMTLTDERGRLFDVNAVPATRQTRSGRVKLASGRVRRVCAQSGRGVGQGSPIRLRPELTLRDLAFAEDPEGSMVPWAATAVGVWRGAPDQDPAWTRLPLDTNVAAVAVDPRDPQRVYGAAVDGLWRSGDAGVTWERWGTGEAVFSLALDPGLSELVYAGLAGGRIAVVRESSFGDQPEVSSVEVPSRLEGPVDRRRLRGVSSVLHQHLSAPPDNPGSAFWQVATATPHTASRPRALYAAEGLSRGLSRDHRRYLRGLLIATLQRLRSAALAHGRELPVTVTSSPGGRWLVSEWRFDDGLRSHSELRLYAPEEQGWERPPSALNEPSDGTWQKLHDLALEPRHLRPAWLFEDPGPRLAWSDNRALLATHGGPDRILVWKVPGHVPEEMGRVLAPRIVSLKRGQDPRGARSALADSGGLMAVARHFGDRETQTRTAALRLWRLGGHAEALTLDVVTRPTSDPSPYFSHLLFTGDERYVVGFRVDGSGQIWRVGLEGDVETEALPGDRFKAITRGPGGNWMATLAGDKHSSELQIWPLREPGRFTPISLTAGTVISQVRFHDDESWLSALADGSARLWDLLERPGRRTRRPSPEEPPEVTLAATTPVACAALFDPRGDWLTHERSASKLWRLRVSGASGQPVRSRRPSWRRVADGDTCSRLPESAQRVGALAIERGESRETLALWNLSGPEPRHLSAQMRRFGPSDLHLDEGALRAPDHVLDRWPERPLKALSDGALRALTCKLVGRPLSREEWSFAMGDAEYRPLCPPLPERRRFRPQ